MAIQSGADDAAQHSFAFAVNDVYFRNASFQTFVQICGYQILHITRSERVQIKYPINRHFHRGIIMEIFILSHLFNNAHSRRIDKIVVFLAHFSVRGVADVDVYSK